jgi:hypothetical protein
VGSPSRTHSAGSQHAMEPVKNPPSWQEPSICWELAGDLGKDFTRCHDSRHNDGGSQALRPGVLIPAIMTAGLRLIQGVRSRPQ